MGHKKSTSVDRLAEIKARDAERGPVAEGADDIDSWVKTIVNDRRWLISEVERLRQFYYRNQEANRL